MRLNKIGGKAMKVIKRRMYKSLPPNTVYVGRPTKWGNPFKIGVDGNRQEVIRKYRQYLLSNPKLLGQLEELKGKDLACWCSPLPCHGDVLLELANKK